MRNNKLIILVTVILAILPAAYAKDFGARGHVYQIIEQPFLQMIDQGLQKVDMKKEQEKMTAIAKDRVSNPAPISSIVPAQTNRTFYFDPTYILDKDAVLHCGQILHKAGTKVNPLEHMTLNRRLFFIDSRQLSQIKWLKGQLSKSQVAVNKVGVNNKASPGEQNRAIEAIEDRIILVGGSVFKLKEELGKEHEDKVYFDQHGELTTRFGIRASPAIVQQDGLMLKVEEIKLTTTRSE